MIYFFFFNDTATTEIYTLSLHDALPIFGRVLRDEAHLKSPRDEHEAAARQRLPVVLALEDVALRDRQRLTLEERDRKSTRLNSSHANISYAVFCLKKKNKSKQTEIYHIV